MKVLVGLEYPYVYLDSDVDMHAIDHCTKDRAHGHKVFFE